MRRSGCCVDGTFDRTSRFQSDKSLLGVADCRGRFEQRLLCHHVVYQEPLGLVGGDPRFDCRMYFSSDPKTERLGSCETISFSAGRGYSVMHCGVVWFLDSRPDDCCRSGKIPFVPV